MPRCPMKSRLFCLYLGQFWVTSVVPRIRALLSVVPTDRVAGRDHTTRHDPGRKQKAGIAPGLSRSVDRYQARTATGSTSASVGVSNWPLARNSSCSYWLVLPRLVIGTIPS